MSSSNLPAGITRAAHTGPRYRTGLRTQTGPLTGGKGLAHMVNYIKLADGGQPAGGFSQLAARGQGPDDSLAHISGDELQMLAQLRGGTEINPQTGLPQFGWLGNLLKGLVRAGASIAGGMIAGPAGAAIGSGLATKLTGGSWSDALKAGATSGIGSWGAQGLTGGGWGVTGNLGKDAAGSLVSQNVDKLSDLNVMRQGLGQGMLETLPEGMSAATPSFGAQFMNYARSTPGIVGAMGALSTPINGSSAAATPTNPIMGPQFSVKPLQRTQRKYTGDLTKYGEGPSHQWYEDINPAPVFGPPGVPGGVDYSNTDNGVPGFADGGSAGLGAPYADAIKQAVQMGYMAAKDGGAAHHGPVRGPGGGQDDLIDAKLSNGEHVVTAREISALGDGDNETGQSRMYALRKQILHKAGYKNTNPRKQTKPIRGIGKFKLAPKGVR